MTEREKTSKTWGDYASAIREQRYVGETNRNKVFKSLPVDYIREWWDLKN